MWYLLIKYSWLVSQKLLELHLAVESGGVCVMVQGNNGCGKSTLLRNYAHTRGYKDGESLLVIHLGEQIDSKVYSVVGDGILHFVHAFGCWICLLGPYLEAKTDWSGTSGGYRHSRSNTNVTLSWTGLILFYTWRKWVQGGESVLGTSVVKSIRAM